MSGAIQEIVDKGSMATSGRPIQVLLGATSEKKIRSAEDPSRRMGVMRKAAVTE